MQIYQYIATYLHNDGKTFDMKHVPLSEKLKIKNTRTFTILNIKRIAMLAIFFLLLLLLFKTYLVILYMIRHCRKSTSRSTSFKAQNTIDNEKHFSICLWKLHYLDAKKHRNLPYQSTDLYLLYLIPNTNVIASYTTHDFNWDFTKTPLHSHTFFQLY